MTTETLTGEVLELDDAVSEQLLGHGRVGVSYSGGVDSATLLALAVRALGSENVVALLGVSPSLARRERRLAHRVAAVIGAEVIEVLVLAVEAAAGRRRLRRERRRRRAP